MSKTISNSDMKIVIRYLKDYAKSMRGNMTPSVRNRVRLTTNLIRKLNTK